MTFWLMRRSTNEQLHLDRSGDRYGLRMHLDVRRILDGQVWPRDPHDFVGDVVDILDEQLADADVAERQDAARQLLALLRDDDLRIRGFAVLAVRRAMAILDETTVRREVSASAQWLEVAPPPMWQITHATLAAEADYRLRVG